MGVDTLSMPMQDALWSEMSVLNEPSTRSRTPWLDLPVARFFTVNRALLVLVVILALTAATRFYDLGTRALHHDESLHAVYSYYLYDRGDYDHQPLMHGPMLFHLTAFGYWLFGANDTTARLIPALLGIAVAGAPWLFRRWIGERGALVTSFLLFISPSMLYYSRFIREDIFFVAWTLIIVYGAWAYLDSGKTRDLGIMCVGWALAFCQKENAYMVAFFVWVFLAIIVGLRFAKVLGKESGTPLKEYREWHLLVLLGALFLPLVTPVLMYVFHFHPGAVGGNSETSIYNSATAWSTQFNLIAYGTAAALFVAGTALAAWLWDWRKFLICAGIFWAIFALFYTTFLTNPFGFGSGLIGSLGYWIEQHEVERGAQPWYYYLMLLPLYEFLPLLFGVIGSIILMVQRRAGAIYEGGAHLSARGLWVLFNWWWFLLSLFLLSYAGEKMPWLLVHIALPLIFLTGWVIGKVLDDLNWQLLKSREGLVFGGLFLVTLFGFVHAFWLIVTGQLPSAGAGDAILSVNLRWLLTAIVLIGVGWFATSSAERIGGKAAQHIAALTIGIILVAATVRYAVLVAYVNSDTPNEPLIFVQSSPAVTKVVDDLADMSNRLTGGNGLKIAYDSHTSWPFDWYLRNYPNRSFIGSSPSTYAENIRNADVVLVGRDSEEQLKSIIPTYIRFEYPMRWWFPEEYKNLELQLNEEPDPANPGAVRLVPTDVEDPSLGNVLSNLWRYYQNPTNRDNIWDFVRERKVKDPLGGENFIVYVRPELAAQIWQYGTAEALPPELSLPDNIPATSDEIPGVLSEAYQAVEGAAPATTVVIGELASPKDVAVLSDGTVAVLDGGNHRVRLYAPDGTLIQDVGTQGAAEGQFTDPWGIAAAPDGSFYVADTWNHRVQHFAADGTFLNAWGEFGDTAGALDNGGVFWGPRDVAVDGDGNVYVADTGNKRVQKFTADGEFVVAFGGNGTGIGQLAEPVGVAAGADGTVYVVDTWNRRVQQFSAEGSPLAQMPIDSWAGQGVLNKPYIAVSSDAIWLTDPEGSHILQLDLTGQIQRVWGAGELRFPFGIAVSEDALYVADSDAGRVVGYELE
jgi:uncharacterized protein (TIGR03663 family)